MGSWGVGRALTAGSCSTNECCAVGKAAVCFRPRKKPSSVGPFTATFVRSRDPNSKPPNHSSTGATFNHSTTDRILCSHSPCFETSAGQDTALAHFCPHPKRSSQPHPPVRVARCVGPFPSTSLRDRVCVIGQADNHSTSEIAGTTLIGQTASGFCKPPATREGVSARSCFPSPPRPTGACLGSGRTRAGRAFPEAFLPSETGAPNLQNIREAEWRLPSAIPEHNQTIFQDKLAMFLSLKSRVRVQLLHCTSSKNPGLANPLWLS